MASAVDNNNLNPNPASQISNHAESTNWCGRVFCRVDHLTLLFGFALIITGTVLFILHSFSAVSLIGAAVPILSTGGALFGLGIIAKGCIAAYRAQLGRDSESVAANPGTGRITANPREVLAAQTSSRDFFESKGIFGVPQELIDEIEIWRRYRQDSENFNMTLDQGFILYGAPGNGKTTIAKAIAEILGGDYVEKKCGDFYNCRVGATENNINSVFNVPENEFRVIVIDEINGFLQPRGENGMGVRDSFVSHFLGVVDGRSQAKPRYIIIGTTNFLDLDPAAMRDGRLGQHFQITNPTLEARVQIFKHKLSCIAGESEEWSNFAENLAAQTEGFSCSAIEGCIRQAQKRAFLASRALQQEDFTDPADSLV